MCGIPFLLGRNRWKWFFVRINAKISYTNYYYTYLGMMEENEK